MSKQWESRLYWGGLLVAAGMVIILALYEPNATQLELSTTPAEQAMQSTVKVKTIGGHGSGVVLTSTGLILTNAHVCQTQKNFEILRYDGVTVTARKVWSGETEMTDLCLIASTGYVRNPDIPNYRVQPLWRPAVFAEADARYGDVVTLTGNPGPLEFVMTRGIVSRPAWLENDQWRMQIDAALLPGSSGGPLWNADWELIGLVNSALMGGGIPVDMNFGVPLSLIKEALAR